MLLPLLVEKLQLLPHPEGGFYKETYRSTETIAKEALPERFSGDRHFSTAIYFLLPQGVFSAFHRIQSDELWHFYQGSSLHIHVILPNGRYELLQLGSHIERGESFQQMVPAGSWFASEPVEDGNAFSFVGCTVAPGFDFADFELAIANELMQSYPSLSSIIQRLCR